MAEYRVKLSNIRIAPRKARLVADLIRRTDVDEAQYQLQYSTKRASDPILKLMKSAVANAKVQNASLNESSLFVQEIRVDEGVTLKRFRPVSRGRAHPIAKKTSHITLVLGVKSPSGSSQEAQSNATEPTNANKEQSSAPSPASTTDQGTKDKTESTKDSSGTMEKEQNQAPDTKDAMKKDTTTKQKTENVKGATREQKKPTKRQEKKEAP